MSVQSEITRLTTAKADIKTAIEGKGVTVPDVTTLDGMAALIEAISGGGDTSVEDGMITRKITECSNNRVTSIGSSAFYDCTNLSTASFPLVTSIGSSAFNFCPNLSTASFPLVTSIGATAFYYCRSLTAVILGNTSQVCTLSSTSTFANSSIKNGGTGYIYVPDALVDSYKAATNWSNYAEQIKPLSEYTGG